MNDLPIVSSSGTPPGVDRRPKPARSQVNIGLVLFVLFTIAALVALSWFVWSINSVLNERTEDLRESAKRITALESQLSASAEIFSQSDETMTDEITRWESETRKVWAGYQRHQAWINENEPKIVQLHQDFVGLDVRMNSLEGSITDIENTLTQIARQHRDLTDEVNTTLQTTKTLLEQLVLSVERHDEDINSIDSYRNDTIKKFLEFRTRLENIESKLDIRGSLPDFESEN